VTIPVTRNRAVELLRKLSWNVDELSPEECGRIRHLYRLDDYKSVAEAMEAGISARNSGATARLNGPGTTGRVVNNGN
jgi:hypothetical protein